MIIIIDDLDRCDENRAVEILDTIKGFLHKKSDLYTFIIPLDPYPLMKSLENTRNISSYRAEEYLQKVFDYTVEIKNIQPYSLYDVLIKLNEKHHFNISPRGISLITDYYAKTPRQMKKFINEYNSMRFIGAESEKMNLIGVGVLSTQDDQLLKVLLIKKLWPKIYEIFVENPHLYNDQSYISLGSLKEDSESLPWGLYDKFQIDTKTIIIEDITPFIYLRDSYRGFGEKFSLIVRNGLETELLHYLTEENLEIKDIAKAYHNIFVEYVVRRKDTSKTLEFLRSLNVIIEYCSERNGLKILDDEISFDAIFEPYFRQLRMQLSTQKLNTYSLNFKSFVQLDLILSKANYNVGLCERVLVLSVQNHDNAFLKEVIICDISIIEQLIDRKVLQDLIESRIKKNDFFSEIQGCVVDNVSGNSDLLSKNFLNELVLENHNESLIKILEFDSSLIAPFIEDIYRINNAYSMFGETYLGILKLTDDDEMDNFLNMVEYRSNFMNVLIGYMSDDQRIDIISDIRKYGFRIQLIKILDANFDIKDIISDYLETLISLFEYGIEMDDYIELIFTLSQKSIMGNEVLYYLEQLKKRNVDSIDIAKKMMVISNFTEDYLVLYIKMISNTEFSKDGLDIFVMILRNNSDKLSIEVEVDGDRIKVNKLTFLSEFRDVLHFLNLNQ